ncbi:unnamed protein product [Paramecium sonneborni]|uniref:Uncharacterized protein n=1 Tax=Paramecium sonneborni TaxID=65129 RepID=A0A8S1PXU6_9CILI|nr:unnamed protein product [Paramecium sonneborni]
MFDKSFNYFIPKTSSNSDNDQREKRESKKQFRYVSVNKIRPSEKDNYIPLVSPQLSAYAKPSERIKLQQKLMRARQNRSLNLYSGKHDSFNITPNCFLKHYTDDSQLTSEDQLLKIVGGQLFSTGEKCQSVQRKYRRKPKTHRNIFSLYVQESLELNQLRKKMNPQLINSRMDSHIAQRFNKTQIGFNNSFDSNQYGFLQQGKRCQMQQKFKDYLN